MSSDIAIKVENLSKCYQIFDTPRDRLKQFIAPRVQNALGIPEKKYYKEFWAVHDVSFEVRKGESVGILGRNGSGKSTLLQMITGTLAPTSGSVQTNGRVAALLELGSGFNPEFTGRDNVYMNGALMELSPKQIDAKYNAIASFADIGDFINRPVKTYSSGMYVRLAFSVAIHCDPDILIIDEALAVGDFIFQQKCNRFLKEQFSGVTKLLVTHDMSAAANLVDRAAVLHHGDLIFCGDAQDAIREYQIVAREEENGRNIDLRNRPIPTCHAGPPVSLKNWIEIPETRLSGTLRVKIKKCLWLVNDCENITSVKDKDRVRIDFEVYSEEDINQIIVGHQIHDRFGNMIFGETNYSSGLGTLSLSRGASHISVEFKWPEMAPGKYSVTMGIGSGCDSMIHTIECWAHNMFILDSSSSTPVHGLFNVKMNSINLYKD